MRSPPFGKEGEEMIHSKVTMDMGSTWEPLNYKLLLE